MREIYNRDIFTIASGSDEAICIPTNGVCKKDGSAVMGKGIAKDANELYQLSTKLGKYIRKYGNRAFDMGLFSAYGQDEHHVLTFPIKNKWWDNSDINIIKKSADEVIKICNARKIKRCYLPMVGCIEGKLDYDGIVRPVLANVLDDRFIVIVQK